MGSPGDGRVLEADCRKLSRVTLILSEFTSVLRWFAEVYTGSLYGEKKRKIYEIYGVFLRESMVE